MNIQRSGGCALLILFFTGVVLAQGEPPYQSEFYESEANRAGFEQAQKSGVLEKHRKGINSYCLAANKKSKDAKLDCQCVARELDAMTDEDLFYDAETMSEYNRQRDEAERVGDVAFSRQLAAEQRRRSALARIQNTCAG